MVTGRTTAAAVWSRLGFARALAVAAAPLLLAACNCGRESAGSDGAPGGDGSSDAGADAATDAGGGDGGGDAGGAMDAASTALRFGVVTLGDEYGAALAGSVAGGFVAAAEVGLLDSGLVPIAGAPNCFELAPPPPVWPDFLDAGDLTFTGLTTDPLVVARDPGGGNYVWSGGGLLGTPGAPIGLDVAGGAGFAAMAAAVPTPDPPGTLSWTSPPGGGAAVTWTAGNGDFVALDYGTDDGPRRCLSPDDGAFTIPPAGLLPNGTPLGGWVAVRRVTETVVIDATGEQSLRLRAYVLDQAL